MCGIFAAVDRDEAVVEVLRGLARLEYRGYDSARVAAQDRGRIDRRRAVGPVAELASLVERAPLAGRTAIGHTRWATHGEPSTENCHPVRAGAVTLVHNGIIENHAELRADLFAVGRIFAGDTDSEVLASVIDEARASGLGPLAALHHACRQARGSYAAVMMIDGDGDRLYLAHRGAPLCVSSDGIAGGSSPPTRTPWPPCPARPPRSSPATPRSSTRRASRSPTRPAGRSNVS